MRFALINNKQVEAKAGLRGICQGCGLPVIAKCGTVKVHHWAHLSTKECDSWWERETEWHRSWKNNFPREWQEVFLPDLKTGEKHMADVRTSHGLVIEFQHSHIKPQERTIRENFYRNVVWVVDGARLKNDYKRFLGGSRNLYRLNQSSFRVPYPEECFPLEWLESSVPVIFDFRGNESPEDPKDIRHQLYCIFPSKIGREVLLTVLPRNWFVQNATNGTFSAWVQNTINTILQFNLELQNQKARQQKVNIPTWRFGSTSGYRRRRRL